MPDITSIFEFTHLESGIQYRVQSQETDDPLVYSVRVCLDRPGAWSWQAYPLTANMLRLIEFPELIAIAPGTVVTPTSPPPTIADNTWTTIVLEEEEPLREIEAGVEYQLRFRVLFHGDPEQPMTGVSTVFQFSHLDSSATNNVQGDATDDPTVYSLRFRLDREGIWQWNAFVLQHRTPSANYTWFPSLLVVTPGTLPTPTPYSPATPATTEGTWAVVALDRHVGTMIVGEETVVTFRVLAEGRDDSPISGAQVSFSLHNNDTGDDLGMFATEPTPGHYELRVTIPDYLHWSWSAIVYGYGNMSPQITGFPWFRGEEPGSGGGTLTIADQPEHTINVLPEWVVPSPLVIEAGTTVTWVNDREIPFLIFGAGGPFEQLGLVAPGESVSWTYEEPGDYAYVIGPAPFFMRGEIRVT